jgi:myo-inositol-1(or 4)-monophosphatase
MLKVLEAVVARLSGYILEKFRSGEGTGIVARRGDDVTREIDLAAEELAYRLLREHFSEGGVMYAEERGVYRWGGERYLFALDPLDGSLNYAAGIPMFSVSLAAGTYSTGTLGDLQYAAVSVLPAGDIYTAGPEAGALKNGVPVRPAGRGGIVFVAIDSNAHDRVFRALRRLGLKGRSLGSSAAELVLTACGAARGFVDLRGRLRAVDVAGALTFGKYIRGFKYVIRGGDSLDSRISLIAGDEEFVNAALAD